jgi:hypothetical protein
MAKLDITKLTLGEVATIEDLAGVSLSELEGAPQGKFLAALVMIHQRRNGEPTFTFNQALATPMDQAQQILGLGDDVPAEDAAEKKDKPATKSAPAKKPNS